MSELLRIVLDTGLFFVGCTVVFVTGVVVDLTAQARPAARTAPANSTIPSETAPAAGSEAR
ncbi:MAG TPA: hypothetical protein VKQ54_00875 [Caulobacteraceae bacterium]|nr:hypothetical protein [Caulobacteraceae bacterium]